jgi:peptidoglycan/LPS O-acetylase OafA/YrhL
VWIASYDKGYTCPDGVARRVLIWIGARSYAIYLIHPFASYATREIMAGVFPGQTFDDTWLSLFLVVGWGLIFGLAALNYSLFEMPLRRRGFHKASLAGQRLAQSLDVPAGADVAAPTDGVR